VTLRSLPRAARIFVVAVIALAAILAVGGMSLELPDLRLFTALLLGSILASLMKLKLPLGSQKVDGSRVYRIGADNTGGSQSKRRSA